MSVDKESVRLVQCDLHALCYSPGPIDGLLGQRTEGAFLVWQQDAGYTNTVTVENELKGQGNTTRISKLKENAKMNSSLLDRSFPDKQSLIDGVCTLAPQFSLPLKAHWAYVLATIEWETARSFQPVEEAYYLFQGDPKQNDGKWEQREKWRKSNLHYHPYYGRGYVQLTWERNYEFYSNLFGISLQEMVAKAAESGSALFVILHGMSTGRFGHSIHRHITKHRHDFVNARRSVNGLDHADDIAKLAKRWMRKI